MFFIRLALLYFQIGQKTPYSSQKTRINRTERLQELSEESF